MPIQQCIFTSCWGQLFGGRLENNDLYCIELYLNAAYYCKHPSFVSTFSEHGTSFNSLESMLCVSISSSAFDTGLRNEDLVKAEAVHNCKYLNKWFGFLSILALSSVTNMEICSHYPYCGLLKYKLLFNQTIMPRVLKKPCLKLHILFCYEGNLPVGNFRHNHYVPLVFQEKTSNKRGKSTAKVSPKRRCIDTQSKIPFCPSATQTSVKCQDILLPKLEPPKVKPFSSTSLFSFFKNVTVRNNSSMSDVPYSYTKAPFEANLGTSSTSSSTVVKTSSSNVITDTPLPQNYDRSDYDRSDVAFFRNRIPGLSDNDIHEMITGAFRPTEKYLFPKSSTGRHFRHVWLKEHPWLYYSVSCDGAFCLPCVIFGDKFPGKLGKIRKPFSEPATYWNDAKQKFKDHETTRNGLHQDTMLVLNNFLSQMSGKSKAINVLVNEGLRKEIAYNRQILVPIIDSIIFCGRTNTSLRGHRDDAQYHPNIGEYSDGRVGNFIELLNFAVRRGDKVLENHLQNHQKNASYISKTSQNKLISCCGQVITDKLISEVKNSKYFSILADEACDSAVKEQLSLVLRYVDSEYNIKEDFLRFVHCKEGLSGKEYVQFFSNV